MSLFGPTKPLQPPAPMPRDIVESDALVAFVSSVTAPNVARQTLELIETLAMVMVRSVAASSNKPSSTSTPSMRETQNSEEFSGSQSLLTASATNDDSSTPPIWAKAMAFGSTGIDANVKSSDVDVVLFCPIFVTQAIFLQVFPSILRRVNELSNITVVSATKVPVVKLKTPAAAVDIVFASCALSSPPTEEQLLLPHSIFPIVSKDTRQSVQGIRTVLEIRRRLPVPFDTFSFTLKAIKYWAMQRKVYGNVFGFPPGVGLAVMVARVCQVYPAAHPSVLFRFFFRFYTQWLTRLNSISPLYITEVLKPDLPRVAGLFDSWDPQRDSAKEELLPVLNPAFPHSNTCYNVGRSGLTAFYSELTRVNLLLTRGAQGTVFTDWSTVWAEYVVGEEYDTFVEVSIVAAAAPTSPTTTTTTTSGETGSAGEAAAAAAQFDGWCAYVESRLRVLFYGLEALYETRVMPQRYATKQTASTCRSSKWYIAIKRREEIASHPSSSSSSPILLQDLAEQIEDFRFSILDLGLRGPNGFQRNPSTMLEPSLRIVSLNDEGVPKEFRPRKRQRSP